MKYHCFAGREFKDMLSSMNANTGVFPKNKLKLRSGYVYMRRVSSKKIPAETLNLKFLSQMYLLHTVTK